MQCPDCKGCGKYHGFNIVEPCTKCNGRGQVYKSYVDNSGCADSWGEYSYVMMKYHTDINVDYKGKLI